MATTYMITAPDGRKFKVTGEGTKEEALAHFQSQYTSARPTKESLEADNRSGDFAGVPTDAGGLTPEQLKQAQAASVGQEPSKPQVMTEYGKDPLGFLMNDVGKSADEFKRLGTGMANVVKALPENIKEVPSAVVSGARNAGTELARTTSWLTGNYDQESFDRAFPRAPEAETLLGKFTQEVTEWLPGMLIGNAAAGGVIKGATKIGAELGKKTQLALRAMGADLGGSMLTADPNTTKIVVGEDSVFKGLKGWGVQDDGTIADDDLFSKKLNLALDTFLVAAPTSGVIGVLGYLLNNVAPLPQLRNVVTLGSKSKQEKIVVRRILESVGDLDKMADPKLRQQEIQNVIDFIKNNKEIVDNFGQYEPALRDYSVDKPTIDSLLEMWNKKLEDIPSSGVVGLSKKRGIANSMEKLTDAAQAHKGSALRSSESVIGGQLDTVTDDIIENIGGGMDNVQTAAGRLETKAQKEIVGPALANKEKLLTDQAQLGEKVKDLLKNDPFFGEFATRTLKLNTSEISQMPATEITQQILQVGDALVEQKNKLFDAIPKTVKGDKSIIKRVVDSIDAEDSTMLNTNIRKAIEATDGNLGQLSNIANVKLRREIDSALNGGDVVKARALRELRKAMTDDQLEFLVEKSKDAKGGIRKEAADKIKAARDFYKREVLPLRNNPVLRDIMDAGYSSPTEVIPEARKAFVRGVDNMSATGGKGPVEYIKGDPSKADVETFLERNVGSSQSLQDYGFARVAEKIASTVNTKGSLSPDDVMGFTKEFERIAPMLSPENKARVEKLLTDVRKTGIIDKESLDVLVDEAYRQVDQVSDEVYEEILGGFFTKHSKQLKINSYESFKGLLNKSDSGTQVKQIMKLAGDDEETIKALKGTMGKYLKDKMFSADGLDTKVLSSIADGSTNMADNIKTVYGDKFYTEFAKYVDGINKVVNRRGAQKALLDVNAPQTAGATSANSILTWFFGVLNPTAARIRTVTGQLLRENTITPQIQEITDSVLANPDEFIRIAELIKKEDKVRITPEMKRILSKLAVRGGFYMSDDPTQEQTKEVFR